MKKSEIKVGGLYLAKVSGKLVTVQVDAIHDVKDTSRYNVSGRPRKASNRYDVTNLSTGRKTTFRSAAKFRGEAKPPKPTDAPVKRRQLTREELGIPMPSEGLKDAMDPDPRDGSGVEGPQS